MHLAADSPSEWLSRHVCVHLTPQQRTQAVPMDRLVAGGRLQEVFAAIPQDDPRRLHHVTELASWYPGTIAMELGYALVGADAAFVPTAGEVGWVLHERGWAEGVVFAPGTRAVVLADHPWAGRPDVQVVASRADVLEAAVGAIVDLTTPLVDHLVAITRSGRQGMWHEVCDALPGVLTWDGGPPVDAALVEDFRTMLARPGNPWLRRPQLELIQASWGTVAIAQRAGCCLSYLGATPEEVTDPVQQRYEAELPEPWSQARYCLNCKFRDRDDSRTRQLWWRHHAAIVAAGQGTAEGQGTPPSG